MRKYYKIAGVLFCCRAASSTKATKGRSGLRSDPLANAVDHLAEMQREIEAAIRANHGLATPVQRAHLAALTSLPDKSPGPSAGRPQREVMLAHLRRAAQDGSFQPLAMRVVKGHTGNVYSQRPVEQDLGNDIWKWASGLFKQEAPE